MALSYVILVYCTFTQEGLHSVGQGETQRTECVNAAELRQQI